MGFIKKYGIGIAIVLTVIACGKKVKVPREFPQKEEMAQILADVHFAEATLSQSRDLYHSDENEIPGYYRYVLNKHELTKHDFDTILAWYSAHPHLLKEVYEQTISILSEKEAQFATKPEDEDKKLKQPFKAEQEDLWKGERAYKVTKKDTIDRCLPFTLEVDSLNRGFLRLVALYKFDKGDLLKMAKMRMVAAYTDSSADSVDYQIEVSFTEKLGNVSLTIPKDKQVVSISGCLLDHDTSEVTNVNIEDVKLLYIPQKEFELK